MLIDTAIDRVYLACGSTDLRNYENCFVMGN
jgi:hypothetical protein